MIRKLARFGSTTTAMAVVLTFSGLITATASAAPAQTVALAAASCGFYASPRPY